MNGQSKRCIDLRSSHQQSPEKLGDDIHPPSGYFQNVKNMTLTLPEDSLIGVRIPPRELHDELRRRLAAALFSDGILSGASACRMAGMGKAEFQNMLGERGIAQPLDEPDYEQDLTNLAAWKAL